MAITPNINPGNGSEEQAAANANYQLKLSAEMKDLSSFSVGPGQSIGKFKQYDTEGNETGSPVDILTIADLGDNRYGELNHWDAQYNPNDRAARHAAWYDKKLSHCVQHVGSAGNQKLRLYGKVIGPGDSEFETDDIHEGVKDPNTGALINFDEFNICVPWLTSFGADYNISPYDMWVPDTSKPNVTIGKNSYTEIRVNFGGYKASAFRTSLWLIPATRNNDPSLTVKFGDDEFFDVNDEQNFVKDIYRASDDPADGVEIDIFEYERTEDAGNRDWIIMKSLGELGDQTKWTDNKQMTGPGVNGADARVPGIGSGWHTIGLLWVEDRTVWFVDGKAYVKDLVNVPNNVRMQIVLSREVTAGNPNDTPSQGVPGDPGIFGDSGASPENRAKIDDDYVEIDYLRVWQVSGYAGSSGGMPSSSEVTSVRYGARNGEIFWDQSGYTNFNVYRDGTLQGSTNGSSFYQDSLTSGRSYTYEVKAVDGSGETSLGTVLMPSDTATAGSVRADRYGADNGEIFWEKAGFSNFNVYRNGALQGSTNGTSFYQSNLTPGTTYTYEVKATSNGSETSLGTVTMPGSP